MAEYEHLCRSGLDEGAIEEDNVVLAAEQPAGSAVDTTGEATETTAAEEQGEKEKKKKKRRKGYSKFTRKPKGKRWSASAYVPVSLSRRKQAPQQRRWRKVLVPAAYKEVDCRVVPQREMRDCISAYVLFCRAWGAASGGMAWCGRYG